MARGGTLSGDTGCGEIESRLMEQSRAAVDEIQSGWRVRVAFQWLRLDVRSSGWLFESRGMQLSRVADACTQGACNQDARSQGACKQDACNQD